LVTRAILATAEARTAIVVAKQLPPSRYASYSRRGKRRRIRLYTCAGEAAERAGDAEHSAASQQGRLAAKKKRAARLTWNMGPV
jgi:hypothetical protein